MEVRFLSGIHSMTRNEAIKFVIIRSLGNFLLLFSLYGVFATFGPAIKYELQYRLIQLKGVQFAVANSPQKEKHDVGFAEIIAGNKDQILIPKDTLFSITIPKIGASSRVIPNVDPTKEEEYLSVLQRGIAHAKGSVFPGMQGNVYLFAHSADSWLHVGQYNAVFYLLKDLEEKDAIVVFFENRRYDYVVSQKIVSEPQDISLLTQSQKGSQRLVLQTCWPPGTIWKRLYIIAMPKLGK